MGSRIFKIYILLILISGEVVFSQQDNTLFLMHDLPQANFVNPAVPSTCKLFMGFPALSSFHANYSNTAFTFKDAFVTGSGDLLYFNGDKIASQVRGKELITSVMDVTLFTMGLHVKEYYLTFSINEKANTYNMVNADMMKLAWYGNSRFTGQEASANGTRVNGNNYHEFAFGASKNIRDNWRLGVRLKILFGIGNVYTPKTKGTLYTDERYYALSLLLNSNVKGALPVEISTDNLGKVSNIAWKDNVTTADYFLNFHNFGLGADLGFIHNIDDKTTLSGSLLDMGGIFWKKDVNNLISDGTISFAGVDGDFGSYDQFVDSLKQLFTPVYATGGYLSPLLPKLYLGVTRNLTKHINAGMLVRSEIYRNRLHPSLTISANTFNYKTLNASVSYTVQNGEFTNIGAGIGLKAGPVQLHLISDNIPGFFMLDNTRNVNVRFGLSFVPGCKERVTPKPAGSNGIRPLPCYYSPYKNGNRRRRK